MSAMTRCGAPQKTALSSSALSFLPSAARTRLSTTASPYQPTFSVSSHSSRPRLSSGILATEPADVLPHAASEYAFGKASDSVVTAWDKVSLASTAAEEDGDRSITSEVEMLSLSDKDDDCNDALSPRLSDTSLTPRVRSQSRPRWADICSDDDYDDDFISSARVLCKVAARPVLDQMPRQRAR